MSPLTESTVSITGMACAACARRVTNVLHDIPGIRTVSVDLIAHQARITPTASANDVVALAVSQIRHLGYGAELVTDGA